MRALCSFRKPAKLIRRSITNPDELAYYLCHGLADTSNEELIRVVGTAGRSRSAENQSGRDTARPEFVACLEFMHPRDTLVVPSLDRLSPLPTWTPYPPRPYRT